MKQNNLNTLYPNFPFRLPMLLDGATGTEMIKAGMPSGICPETWILDHPEAIVSLQNRYIAAGADAVLAPTFGANRTVLERMRWETEPLVSMHRLPDLLKIRRRTAVLSAEISPRPDVFLFPGRRAGFRGARLRLGRAGRGA